jgi:hypothetical protein
METDHIIVARAVLLNDIQLSSCVLCGKQVRDAYSMVCSWLRYPTKLANILENLLSFFPGFVWRAPSCDKHQKFYFPAQEES